MGRFINNLIRHIKNVIRWFPIIWKDEDWDSYYLYIILRKKISNMEQFFNSDTVYTKNAKQKAKQMKLCVLLLDRLIADNYMAKFDYKKIDEALDQREFEKDLLFKKLSKQVESWWD